MLTLQQFILTNMESILVEWEDFARKLYPHLDSVTLRDHAHAILETIADEMKVIECEEQRRANSRGDTDESQDLLTSAHAHASSRWDIGFDLQQLIAEYRALRASVISLWTSKTDTADTSAVYQLMRFNEALDHALAATVRQFGKLVVRNGELNAAIRVRDEFLAMLGHELRNPLAPIRSATEVIRALAPPNSQIQENTEILTRQVGHLTRIVEDLLVMDRITHGRISLDPHPTSLAQVMDQAVEMCRPFIHQREHSLTVTLPDGHDRVNVDTARMVQAFSNLLHNAAKFTPAGGHIHLSATLEDDRTIVQVKDNGPGIPPSVLNSIFDLFSQAPQPLARTDGGLGVGLALVKRLVELHGGKVDASNAGGGNGAVFSITLPLLPEQPELPKDETCSEPNHEADASHRRVLIIDDNKDANAALRQLVELSGHTVMSAYDGLEGIKAAESFMPDVILLDIGLPGMDGYKVAGAIRGIQATRHAYIVAITGYGKEKDVQRAREAGCDAHLLKPAAFSDVLSHIWIAEARSNEALED